MKTVVSSISLDRYITRSESFIIPARATIELQKPERLETNSPPK